MSTLGAWAKRSFDLVLSGAGLIVSAPLWALIAAAMTAESPGPVFFTQLRVGEKGRTFNALKFRSMIVEAERASGPVQATEHDPRITRVGSILRATAMDELPQLWNIFRGDMSFVGPRALRLGEPEPRAVGHPMSIQSVPGYLERSSVRPGLTGLAQIYAPRDVLRRHKFRYDCLYVRRQSFGLDLCLIALSFWITTRGTWETRGRKF